MAAMLLDRVYADEPDSSTKLHHYSLPTPIVTSLSVPDQRSMVPSLRALSNDGHESVVRAGHPGAKLSKKGKERAFNHNNNAGSASEHNLARSTQDSYSSGSLSFTSERPSPGKRSRGSLLVVASDALGFRFGKRHKSVKLPPPNMPIILPGVIEISAPRPDVEEEERQQLRDAAAQAIGLTSSLLQPDSPPTVDDDELGRSRQREPFDRDLGTLVPEAPAAETVSPPMSPTYSLPIIGRQRPGSLLSHSRSNSIVPMPIPDFPSSPAALSPFLQASATLPKYYTPSSLRIFALSKQWKSRYLILSQPAALATTKSSPNVSYLHLFKTSDGSEKELERLEINEDSVVFVAEEEVSGRRQVVKVGGTDVGARKKDLNHEEGGRTMWFLQICDQSEAQKWIATIKQSIFGQRAVRAGLGSPGSTFTGVEPRGDIDVMLSMRAQGIVNSPPREKLNLQELTSSRSSSVGRGEQTMSSAASLHSTRSQATTAKPGSTSAVSTLKGLFTSSTRPRSGSRSTSVESDRTDSEDTTFGSMGTNLLNMGVTQPALPVASAQDLDKKIITDEQLCEAPNIAHPFSATFQDRAARAKSMVVPPLQPAPRSKRWTSAGESRASVYQHEGETSFGHERTSTEPATLFPNGFRTPEQRPRAGSIQSVSTMASSEHASTTSTKRSSSMKRWSRQLPLPKRMTPPMGPPPAIPSEQSSPQSHPYSSDRPHSRDSSIYSATSGQSRVSTLPSFSKRTSVSSYISVTSTSTSHSLAPSQNSSVISHSRPGSSHRTSMPPPPRPAPTTALPPAPVEEQSVRKSAAKRSFRMSLMAPKPPPTMSPPPAPDDYRSRRSSASASLKSPLATIPSSPNPSLNPLRPTPPSISNPPSTTSSASSLKQRLRILSAPSPLNTTATNSNSSMSPLTPPPPLTPTSLTAFNHTGGEKNANFNIYDHSYMQLYTPSTPTGPGPKIHMAMDDEPVLRSLSPPPRRMSRQINLPEKNQTPERERAPENVPLPLSPRGSVVSLGILTMS